MYSVITSTTVANVVVENGMSGIPTLAEAITLALPVVQFVNIDVMVVSELTGEILMSWIDGEAYTSEAVAYVV